MFHLWMRSRFAAGVTALILGSASLTSAQTGPPYTRYDAYSAEGQEMLKSYAKGVEEMKKLSAQDPSNPLGWTYQANMHGTVEAQTLQGWKTCQHGSWFFLSWHRMYLHEFEGIVRVLSGDPNFTLPYWNYAVASQRAIPLIFRDSNSPLFTDLRAAGVNAGGALPASAVSNAVALSYKNFSATKSQPGTFGLNLSFGGLTVSNPLHFGRHHGQLESQPHDVIHDVLGGDQGLMADPNTAAQDPIFYLHHSNIDRLWKRWLDQGGGRKNPSVSTSQWLKQQFVFFDIDPATRQAKQITLTGAQILDTVSQLNYRYDDDPPIHLFALAPEAVPEPTVKPVASKPESLSFREGGQLTGQPLTVQVSLASKARSKLSAALASTSRRIGLHVEGLEFERNPGLTYEIYLNLPEAQMTNPDPQSLHYVGNLTFFGRDTRHRAAGQPDLQSFDITKALRALKKQGLLKTEDITVTFYPRRIVAPPDAMVFAEHPSHPPVKIGQVRITTE